MNAPEIVSSVLKELRKQAKAGVKTIELDSLAEKIIIKLGGRPYNKGYRPPFASTPFPATLCVSVNEEIVHGIPRDRELQGGDLVNFDVGVEKDGKCGDAAFSMGIGEISTRDKRLLWNAKRTLWAGIQAIRNYVLIRDVSRAMERYATSRGYVTNNHLVGHGIGKKMHEDPPIPAFVMVPETPNAKKVYETFLKTGMQLCIEPQITYTDRQGVLMSDGWTVRTLDGQKSAFFEAQVRVTDDGCDILTDHIDFDSHEY